MCSPSNGPRDLNGRMDHLRRILRRRRSSTMAINRHPFSYFYSSLFLSSALFGILITLTLASPATLKVGDSLAHLHSNQSQTPTHHQHHHHPKHSHHRHLNNTNSTAEGHNLPSGGLLHLLEPLQKSQHPHDDSSRLLPSSSSSPHPTDGADGQLLLPPSLDGSPVDLSNLNPKGLKFEEEPSDSYIVRSKSALLRCKTLNALNAWFTCNSGDERKIQSNQKISNYVDPEKGIRMIEIDLEVTRSDVEEHTNSGYTNPFQCWCTAYGGQHQIMSRKASVSFSYLKRHFYTEPLSRAVPVDTKHLVFDCVPPEGDPKPIVFWMKNDVIIAETQPKSFPSASSSVGLTISKKGGISSKQAYRANMQKSTTRRVRASRAVEDEKPKSAQDAVKIGDYERQHPVGHEAFPDPYGVEQNSKPGKSSASSAPKATEVKVAGDDEEDDEYEDEEEDEETEEDSKSSDHTADHHGDLLPLNFDDPPPLDRNYLMTADYSLVIQQVKLTDSGNYSCGVRNPAGTRFSGQAQLTVFVNGEWSNWSSWGPCILPTGQKCGQGAQKRVRQCSSPASVPSNVQFCPGEPVQILECTVVCSSISSSGSYWSPWSDWSPCGHDCTQVRRRVCNNPTPDIGANDCFGPDFMARNCSNGSLCRKIFDPPLFPPGNGPFLQPPGNSPLPAEHSNEQIYFFIIFLLTLIILLCILYISLKFLNRRRHRGAKAAYHSGTNGWTDMLALERATSAGGGGGHTSEEDAQAMLMLLQQQQTGSLPGGPGGVQCQLQMSGLTSAQMARYQGARSQQQMVNRSHPFGTTSSSSSSSSAGNATPQPEKYPFISRLKHPGTASSKSNNLLIDHLVLRNGVAGNSEAHPLPTIPSVNSLNSFVTGNSSVNKYEEPIFPNGLLRSPHPSSNHHHFLHSKPPLPPNMPQTTSALSNTSGSGNTGTISTNTTNTSESENSNESEPDYAEPIINYESSGGPGGVTSGPRPPSVPPPLNKNPSTPLLQRSTVMNSSLHSSEIAFSKAEKFIKLTDDLLEGGHFSMMANLGVGLWISPGFIAPGQLETNNLYLRYGIDTAAKLPSTPLMYSSLSSVVTVAFSKSPNSGAVPPTFSGLLWRPFVLAFKHCIAVRGNSVASLAKALGSKNLTVLWQDVEGSTKQGSSAASWTEVLRYGDEDLNTGCYVEFDAQYVYLVSKYVGRYVLCVKTDQSGPNRKVHPESPLALSLSPNLHHAEFSKLINFSLSIEQLTSTEHLVKVYAYDNLPSSTLALRNDLSPTSSSSSVNASTIRLRVGKSTISSSLRLSGRGGSLFFELKPPDRTRHRIKGSSRLEVPLAHVWFTSGGSTSPLAVSFIVANNSTVIRECTRKGCSTLNGSSGIYENELPFFDELDEDDHHLLRHVSSTSPVDSSDSDELVAETDQESAAEEAPNGHGHGRRKAAPHQAAKQQPQLDHLHETEADLNYEVTVWQGAGTAKNSASPISSLVTLNSATTIRLCQPANTSAYYVERSLRHLFTEVDLQVRQQIVDALDRPRSDQLDWRSLASAAGFDHYLPFFATQPSPSASILELWEAKVLNVLLLPKSKTHHCRTSSSSTSASGSTTSSGALSSSELSEVKDLFYSKLVHLLQTIQRSDLIELILSNQC